MEWHMTKEEQKLYSELYRLRDRIKNQERLYKDRAPLVCSDEALYEIVMQKPKCLEDFKAVTGIGKTFIDEYGNMFLDIIKQNVLVENEKDVSFNDNVAKTLKELSNKLVTLNKRNHLLYLPKLANKHSIDLYNYRTDILESLFNHKTAFIEDYGDQKVSIIQKFKQLKRENNRITKEKGRNDMYVGLPFVEGKLAGEDFNIRCPLVLFPVEINLDNSTQVVELKLDESRDVVFNSNLILAHFKFSGIKDPLPEIVFNDVSSNSFINEMLEFYKKNGLNIFYNGDNQIVKFKEYLADEFPTYNNGQLILRNELVIGNFAVCANAIQRDFDTMIENGKITNIVNDLLVNTEDIDYYSDDFFGDDDVKENDKDLEIKEHDFVYINDLNSSQESVLSGIKKYNELVIQGPPGTGKSQTITNLIANSINENKTTLMVSEKKTALDVVYSRLGELSKYALLIDDSSNKTLFYEQMDRMINNNSFFHEGNNIDLLNNDIENEISKLKRIADVLYTPGSFGIEPYKMYVINKKLDLTSEKEKKEYDVIYTLIRKSILYSIKYSDLESLYRKYSDREYIEKLIFYLDVGVKYPFITDLKNDLSDYDIQSLNDQINNFEIQVEEWKNKPFASRFFSKHKLLKNEKKILKQYFNNVNSKMLKNIFNNLKIIRENLWRYNNYQIYKTLFLETSTTEKEYLKLITDLSDCFEYEPTICNELVFNDIIYYQINEFEKQNKLVLSTVDDFSNVINRLSEAIKTKKQISKKNLEKILYDQMSVLKNCKRRNDLLRAIEGKRKQSINTFISKYKFELFKSIRVWMLTPEVVSEIVPLEAGIFDLVIFDEASQMYIEKGIPSIQRAKKVIVAGDHKQLRPSNLGAGRIDFEIDDEEEINAALEEESLLDLARFKYRDYLLNFHYRSKYEELIAFSNYAFYKAGLYVSPNVQIPENPPIEYRKIENGLWADRKNIPEAKNVVNLLKDILKNRKNSETVGIITFNINQRDLIDDLIDEECLKDQNFAASIKAELDRKEDGQDIGLFVKNIESVQGDERDIIIFSIGYAKNSDGKIVRNFGWLNQKGGENRLNVAVSRAKEKVYVVSSIEPDELVVEDTQNDGPKYFKKYLEYAKAISNRDNESAKNILCSFSDRNNSNEIRFDSSFEEQVYDALKDKGYDVDTQVGIGGYSIDLAIKKDGNYVIGIECDGKLYHSSKSARERDYHRQKYLESRGWKIHRIWSTNWWKNPNREIEKISELVSNI